MANEKEKVHSTNGIWHSRYAHDEGYGDTYWSHGRVNIVDGEVYLDSTSLTQCFARLKDRVVGFEFVEGIAWLKQYGEYDERIQPLVAALQSLGVRTLNSCEGHLEERYGYLIRYPYVDFPAKDASLFPALPPKWTILEAPFGDSGVSRLRTVGEADNAETLEELKVASLELARQWQKD